MTDPIYFIINKSQCRALLQEQLRIPRRRLIRSSKKHPLSLHAAGRFSSHRFLLFNDVLVHQQVCGRVKKNIAVLC